MKLPVSEKDGEIMGNFGLHLEHGADSELKLRKYDWSQLMRN